MSYLVENPEDRFSRDEAQIILEIFHFLACDLSINTSNNKQIIAYSLNVIEN